MSFRQNYQSVDFKPYKSKDKSSDRLHFNQNQAEKYSKLMQKQKKNWRELPNYKQKLIVGILNRLTHTENDPEPETLFQITNN